MDDHSRGVPFANTCANCLHIPVLADYELFKERMLLALEVGLTLFRIPSISVQTFTMIQKLYLVPAVCEGIIIALQFLSVNKIFCIYINKCPVVLSTTAAQG